MKCQNCNEIFKNSPVMNFSMFLLNVSMYSSMVLLKPLIAAPYIFAVVFPTAFVIMAFISIYMPVKTANIEDVSMLGPTRVNIEKTDDVNENIRRYKKAINDAIKKKREKRLS